MLKPTIYLALLAVFVLVSAKASCQDSSIVRKNHIKVSAISLALFNTSMMNYERQIKPNFSLSVGFGRKYTGSLPSFLNQDKFNLTLGQTDFKGTFLNLDARWYLNKCEGDESIEGFYIGPYTKFIKYSLDFDMTYDDGDQFLENSGNASFREFGLGLMLGYQLLLWDRLVVDFLFFGPRTSRYRLKFNFEEELSQEFIDSVTNNINETLDKILMRGGIDPEIEPRELRTSFSWASFRYGISFGFAF